MLEIHTFLITQDAFDGPFVMEGQEAAPVLPLHDADGSLNRGGTVGYWMACGLLVAFVGYLFWVF